MILKVPSNPNHSMILEPPVVPILAQTARQPGQRNKQNLSLLWDAQPRCLANNNLPIVRRFGGSMQRSSLC